MNLPVAWRQQLPAVLFSLGGLAFALAGAHHYQSRQASVTEHERTIQRHAHAVDAQLRQRNAIRQAFDDWEALPFPSKRDLARPDTWPALFERLQREHPVTTLSFAFGPPAPLTPESPSASLIVRPLTLQLTLIHEPALLAFLAALVREAPAHAVLRRCQLKRLDDLPTSGGAINATCELDWITR